MIAAGNDELRIWQALGNRSEGFDHQLQPFVGSPFAKGENAMFRIAAPRKIRVLGAMRKNAVGAHVHVVAAVSLRQYLPVVRHQHRDRIRQQQDARRDGSCQTVRPRKTDSEILQVHRVHEVVQRYMRVPSCEAREKRGGQAGEGVQRVVAECAEK